jgi:hypothetical protein
MERIKMKKLSIMLFVFVVVGGLIAQELKWNGGVFMGLGLKSDGSAPTISDEFWWWGDGPAKAGAQIEAAYAEENARLTLKLRGYFSNTNEYSIGVPMAKVEFDLFNNLVGIRAGRLDEGLWNTDTNMWWQVTNGVGALVEFKPVEGVSIGGILKTNGPADGVKSPTELFKRAAFGASYKKGDLLYVSAAAQLADGDRDAGGELNKAASATYALDIFAVTNLILNTEGRFSNIGGDGDIKFELAQDVGYNISPGTFKAVLRGIETLGGGDDAEIALRPYAEWVINKSFTANLEVEGKTKLTDDPKVALYVQPKITYNVAPNAVIQAYYRVDIPTEGDPAHQVKISFGRWF